MADTCTQCDQTSLISEGNQAKDSLGSSHFLYYSCLFRCSVLLTIVILVSASPKDILQLADGSGRIPAANVALSSPVLELSGCFSVIRKYGKKSIKLGT